MPRYTNVLRVVLLFLCLGAGGIQAQISSVFVVQHRNECVTDDDCYLMNGVCFDFTGLHEKPRCACQEGQIWDNTNLRCDWPGYGFTTPPEELLNVRRRAPLFTSEAWDRRWFGQVRLKGNASEYLLPRKWTCDARSSYCWARQYNDWAGAVLVVQNISVGYTQITTTNVSAVMNVSSIQVKCLPGHVYTPLLEDHGDNLSQRRSLIRPLFHHCVNASRINQAVYVENTVKVQSGPYFMTLPAPEDGRAQWLGDQFNFTWLPNRTCSNCGAHERCWETRVAGRHNASEASLKTNGRCMCEPGFVPDLYASQGCTPSPAVNVSSVVVRDGGTKLFWEGEPSALLPWLTYYDADNTDMFVVVARKYYHAVSLTALSFSWSLLGELSRNPFARPLFQPYAWGWTCVDRSDFFVDTDYAYMPPYSRAGWLTDRFNYTSPHCRGYTQVCETLLAGHGIRVHPVEGLDIVDTRTGGYLRENTTTQTYAPSVDAYAGQCVCNQTFYDTVLSEVHDVVDSGFSVTGTKCDACSRGYRWIQTRSEPYSSNYTEEQVPSCAPYVWCSQNMCGSKGACSTENLRAAKRQCDCYTDYMGFMCEERKTDCTVTQCNSRGVCVMSKDGDVNCRCLTGFKGERCDLTNEQCAGDRGDSAQCLTQIQGSICPLFFSLANCSVIQCNGGLPLYNDSSDTPYACSCGPSIPTHGPFCEYDKCGNNGTWNTETQTCDCVGAWRRDVDNNCTEHVCSTLTTYSRPSPTNFSECECPTGHTLNLGNDTIESATRYVCEPNCVHGEVVYFRDRFPLCSCDKGWTGYFCEAAATHRLDRVRQSDTNVMAVLMPFVLVFLLVGHVLIWVIQRQTSRPPRVKLDESKVVDEKDYYVQRGVLDEQKKKKQ